MRARQFKPLLMPRSKEASSVCLAAAWLPRSTHAPDCSTDDGGDAKDASEADAEAAAEVPRPRRGGAAPAQLVGESEIRTVIKKLEDTGEYWAKMNMLQELLKLQVERCNVGGQSAFKTWIKLAKDEGRSLAEGTDAVAVLLELLEDVDGMLKRIQDQTPLNPKMREEQKAVREIVPEARRILLSYAACPPTTALLTRARCGSCWRLPASSWSTVSSPHRSPATRPSPSCTL